MRKTPLLPAGALAGLFLASWAGADPPPPRAEPATRPGERLDFHVSLGPLPQAAHVRVETLPPAAEEGKDRLRLLADVTPGPLFESILSFHYHLVSTVSLPALLPLRSSRQTEEGDERVFTALTFDHAAGKVLEADRAGGESRRTDPIRADTRDLLAAMYHARRLKAGTEAHFSVFENGRLYAVQALPLEPETITVPVGTFRAHRFRVEAAGTAGDRPVREMEIWIGPAPANLPLRMRALTPLGAMVAELARYRPPTNDP